MSKVKTVRFNKTEVNTQLIAMQDLKEKEALSGNDPKVIKQIDCIIYKLQVLVGIDD